MVHALYWQEEIGVLKDRFTVTTFVCLLTLDRYALQTRGETLCKLVSLFGISHNKSVQMARASDLEFGLRVALADFDKLGIVAASLLEEISDVCNLLRHIFSVSV